MSSLINCLEDIIHNYFYQKKIYFKPKRKNFKISFKLFNWGKNFKNYDNIIQLK